MLKYSVTIEGGQRILLIDAVQYPHLPTLEDNPEVMAYVIDVLTREGNFSEIRIDQIDEYVYGKEQTEILNEIAEIYRTFLEEVSQPAFFSKGNVLYNEFIDIRDSILSGFKRDPIQTYLHLKRELRKLKYINKTSESLEVKRQSKRLISFLEDFIKRFESTRLYTRIKDILPYVKGIDRSIYFRMFSPDIRPSFIYSRITKSFPENSDIIEAYKVSDSEVTIIKIEDEPFYRYYIFPPEIFLTEDEQLILIKTREKLATYTPKKEDYYDPHRLRETSRIIIDRLLEEVASGMGIKLTRSGKEKLIDILIRHTIGFGILEPILKDPNIQDVLINAPPSESFIFVNHAIYEGCKTNIRVSSKEAESWATKLRLISGRPFDEANPVLDTELDLGTLNIRVSAIMDPLSPFGLSFAFRRHRDNPWTLPLFIENKMLSPLAAGLLSFLIFGGRTILIAGTRGAGKTSLLTALLLEIPRKTRIITVEDTLEIPAHRFRSYGYNIQTLKVRSPLSLQSSELSAEDGIRVSLRLGDSALIVGEVRSKEARTLYEAMRVGALANVVMGTIHAESPYGVYDRVVNDLGVPKTSFKATDIIVIANPITDPSGLRKRRRVIQITEVRKHWEEDPIKEKGFVDIMRYDVNKDELVPTLEFIHGDVEVLKSLASRIKGLAGSWERVWDQITMRAEAKKMLVDIAKKTGKRDILEAPFVIKSNDKFLEIMNEVYEEIGYPEKGEVIRRYNKWLLNEIK